MIRSTVALPLLLATMLMPCADAHAATRPPPTKLLCPQNGLKPLGKDYNNGKAILDNYGIILAPIGLLASFSDWLNSDSLAAKPRTSLTVKTLDAAGQPLKNAQIALIYTEDERFLAQVPQDGKPITLPVGNYLINAVDASSKPVWGAQFITLEPGKPTSLTLKLDHALSLDPPAALKGPLHAGTPLALEPFADQVQQAATMLLRDGKLVASSPEQGGALILPSAPGHYQLQASPCAPVIGLGNWPVEILPSTLALKAPASVAAYASFDLTWSGDGAEGDEIGIRAAKADAPVLGRETLSSGKHKLTMIAPAEPGDYDITYLSAGDHQPLATARLHVTQAQPLIQAPESLMAGESVTMSWPVGPGNGEKLELWSGSGSTAKQVDVIGRTGLVRLFAPAGTYELRLAEEGHASWSRPLQIKPAQLLSTLPPTLVAGSEVPLPPGLILQGFDDIAFYPTGTRDYSNNRLTHTQSKDRRVVLVAPPHAGTYDLVYLLSDEPGKTLLIEKRTLAVSAGAAATSGDIAAPDAVDPLEEAQISWSNPETRRLDIWLLSAGKPPRRMRTLESGGLFTLGLPPGSYKLHLRTATQHELDGDNDAAKPPAPDPAQFQRSLVVRPTPIMQDVPQTIERGADIALTIAGKPGFFDQVVIAAAGTRKPDEDNISGSSATHISLQAPDKPGRYELVYIGSFNGGFADRILERKTFIVK